MNDLDAGILRCPITKKPLAYRSASMLASEDGAYGYPIVDGILLLTVDKAIDLATVRETGTSVRQEKQSVRDFYDRFGWKRTASGKYGDTTRFVDQRELSYGFTESCMRRVGTYLPQSGTYLLDAGSGAIPHRTYMDYHANYERRICVDFSIEALHEAKRKLGDRGVYILGDITNLPLSDNAMDAVISNHVIYHVPADEQARAFEELWRVTRPGGRAVVVYSWEGASLPRWIRQFATRVLRLRKNEGALPQEQGGKLNFYFHSHTLKWFQEQAWPFHYTIRSFRVVNNEFLRSYLADNTRSQLLVGLLRGMQRVFSGWCGRHGQYPIIVIPK